MITIKKGNHTLQVSKNTYETMFKIMGYTIVDEKEEAKKEASSTNDNIQTSDIEKNTIITIEVDDLTSKDIMFMINLGKIVKKDMTQEAISVIINNALCLV